MKSSKILLKDGNTVDLVDGRIADGDIASWNNRLKVDGTNATTEGVTAMMKKVESGSVDLTDDSYYFGDSNVDHTQIVRRPILNIWNYIKNKVKTQLLGSVGSADKPIYLENGVPKVCNSSNLKAGKDDDGNVIKNTYQKKLTFDIKPTAGSTNPVTSEGINTALEVLQSNIDTVDAKGIVINKIDGENVICFE